MNLSGLTIWQQGYDKKTEGWHVEAGKSYWHVFGKNISERVWRLSVKAVGRVRLKHCSDSSNNINEVRDEDDANENKKSKNIQVMNIKPLADRVLVKPAPAEEKTVGGIIIPDTAKEKPLQGTVLAVGNGTKDEEMVLKANDTVLYGKYSGTEVEIDGEKYLIMRQSDVLAVLA